MNHDDVDGFEIDGAVEAEIGTEVRRAIVPPATPLHVRAAVEMMAANGGRGPLARRLVWRGAYALTGLAAAALVVAIIGVSLSLRGSGPAAPTARPTPGTPGPVLPDPGAGQTPATSFQWTGDGLTAWASTGDGRIRFTEDGGVTWSAPVTVPAADPSGDTGLDFVDRLHGWQTTTFRESGIWRVKVWRTANGGLSWTSSDAATVPDEPGLGLLSSTHFADANHGVALLARSVETPGETPAAASSQAGTTYKGCVEYVSVDGGATWAGPSTSVCLPGGVRWATRSAGIAFQPTRTSVASTIDGGSTWRTALLPGIPPDQVPWNLIPSIDGRGVLHLLTMVVPANGTWSTAPVVRYSSDDAGSTWVEESRSTTPDGLGLGSWTSVLGPDYYLTIHQIGTGVPAHGDDFLRSTDGGRTWQEVATNGITMATYMDWADEIHGWLSGIGDCMHGIPCWSASTSARAAGVFLTDDGGRTWHQLAFP
jgi:hypothetical protein